MAKLTEKELEEIKKMVEEEFPYDPALQQVHIARKIISREAEKKGMSFVEYVKLIAKEAMKERGQQGA